MIYQTSRLIVLTVFIGFATPAFQAQSLAVIQPTKENVAVPIEGESSAMADFGGRPVVDVTINGKGPYLFIFDTGASFCVIDSSLAAELSLEETTGTAEFRVGKVVVRDAHYFVNPISKMLGGGDVPRGVLSASFFPGALVVFDFPAKRISFRKGALPEADGKAIFGYDPADLPTLPVNLAGKEVVVHLDTGAPYALALPTKYMKEIPLTGPPVQKGQARTHSGLAPIFLAPFKGTIAIGSLKLPLSEVRFTDIVPFAGVEPKGQVGNESLRRFVVTLDSANHRIRLAEPG